MVDVGISQQHICMMPTQRRTRQNWLVIQVYFELLAKIANGGRRRDIYSFSASFLPPNIVRVPPTEKVGRIFNSATCSIVGIHCPMSVCHRCCLGDILVVFLQTCARVIIFWYCPAFSADAGIAGTFVLPVSC